MRSKRRLIGNKCSQFLSSSLNLFSLFSFIYSLKKNNDSNINNAFYKSIQPCKLKIWYICSLLYRNHRTRRLKSHLCGSMGAPVRPVTPARGGQPPPPSAPIIPLAAGTLGYPVSRSGCWGTRWRRVVRNSGRTDEVSRRLMTNWRNPNAPYTLFFINNFIWTASLIFLNIKKN